LVYVDYEAFNIHILISKCTYNEFYTSPSFFQVVRASFRCAVL
jgi:hypothetical protein